LVETVPAALAAWSNFYVIAGSSAAALTGLIFVVITLVRGEEFAARDRHDGIATFSTPTVMHFCTALLVSAVLCAPWPSLVYVSVIVALAGCYGVVYILRVAFRTRGLKEYTADLEDWIWYSILPFIAYATLAAGAIALHYAPKDALFVVAGGVLLLIFIGIRNAWDVVTFLAAGGASEG
jgi:hypothetical protein